jgi:hypothetical protein
MTETRELHISFSELSRVSFACGHCGLESTINIDKAEQMERLMPIGAPGRPMSTADRLTCAICNTTVDRYLIESFYFLKSWKDKVTASGVDVTLRISAHA